MFLQALKVVASEGDTCIPSLFVINTTINQLESKVSLKTICCLRLFVVDYKLIYNVAASEEIVGERCVPSLIVINSTINQLESKVSLITTRCLRLFVVVFRVEML